MLNVCVGDVMDFFFFLSRGAVGARRGLCVCTEML